MAGYGKVDLLSGAGQLNTNAAERTYRSKSAMLTQANASFARGASLFMKMDKLLNDEQARLDQKANQTMQQLGSTLQTMIGNEFRERSAKLAEDQFDQNVTNQNRNYDLNVDKFDEQKKSSERSFGLQQKQYDTNVEFNQANFRRGINKDNETVINNYNTRLTGILSTLKGQNKDNIALGNALSMISDKFKINSSNGKLVDSKEATQIRSLALQKLLTSGTIDQAMYKSLAEALALPETYSVKVPGGGNIKAYKSGMSAAPAGLPQTSQGAGTTTTTNPKEQAAPPAPGRAPDDGLMLVPPSLTTPHASTTNIQDSSDITSIMNGQGPTPTGTGNAEKAGYSTFSEYMQAPWNKPANNTNMTTDELYRPAEELFVEAAKGGVQANRNDMIDIAKVDQYKRKHGPNVLGKDGTSYDPRFIASVVKPEYVLDVMQTQYKGSINDMGTSASVFSELFKNERMIKANRLNSKVGVDKLFDTVGWNEKNIEKYFASTKNSRLGNTVYTKEALTRKMQAVTKDSSAVAATIDKAMPTITSLANSESWMGDIGRMVGMNSNHKVSEDNIKKTAVNRITQELLDNEGYSTELAKITAVADLGGELLQTRVLPGSRAEYSAADQYDLVQPLFEKAGILAQIPGFKTTDPDKIKTPNGSTPSKAALASMVSANKKSNMIAITKSIQSDPANSVFKGFFNTLQENWTVASNDNRFPNNHLKFSYKGKPYSINRNVVNKFFAMMYIEESFNMNDSERGVIE